MKAKLVLPRLSALDFTIGKEDEMLTVNMLPPATVTTQQGYEQYFPRTLYLAPDQRWSGVCVYACFH